MTRIKNKEYHISQFIFSIAEDQKLYIMADPNDLKKINYKRVQEVCLKHKITFRNQ
jgi:hypothetical protein